MSFIIQHISGPRVILREYRQSALTIGRGTTAQLRSENPSVALDHAVIEASEGGFDLVDKGSITGTYLNGRAIENARLGPGDTIEVGDLSVTVKVAQPGQPLFLRVETLVSDEKSVDEVEVPLGTTQIKMPAVAGESLKAPRVDYVASYQLKRGLLSKSALVVALVLISVGALVVVFRAERHEVFRPGNLSLAHTQVVAEGVRLIGDNNCTACHEPWGGAPDSKCQACHKQAGHRADLPATGSCGDCHAEHRQLRNLSLVVERHCTDCHRDLVANAGALRAVTVKNNIEDFEGSHPEFRIDVLVDGIESRVAIDSPEGRSADANILKFNHKCHMSGKCNKRPPTPTNPNQEIERFECESCHQIEVSTGAMLPISYDNSCARCHPLTFDNRFPPVPHYLDLQTVAGFIANAYSGNESMLRMSADEVSRVFAQGRSQVNVASTIVRNAQRTLQARCQACHELDASGAAVVPPTKSKKWLRGTKVFDHRSHMNESLKARCVDCHDRASESEKTTDLNLPGIASCKPCHRQSSEHAGRGIETCQTCHYFHELSLAYGEGWTLQAAEIPPEMKLAAVGDTMAGGGKPKLFGLPFWVAISIPVVFVVLVGVAGVFVGAARSVVSRPKIPRLPKGEPPSTPQPPRATKVSPSDAPAPAAGKPAKAPKQEPEPVPNVPDSTIAMDVSEIKGEIIAAAAGKTVATAYFGSIAFLTGPLAGRRFAVDTEKGSHVGRDQNLADIFVDDARISRRHVWVGVRSDVVMVVDQNSTNGTYLEKEPAKRITEARLEHGDVVILGENAARFRYEP